MVLENPFHLGIEGHWASVKTLILQLHLDVEPELVVFGENCYHRN